MEFPTQVTLRPPPAQAAYFSENMAINQFILNDNPITVAGAPDLLVFFPHSTTEKQWCSFETSGDGLSKWQTSKNITSNALVLAQRAQRYSIKRRKTDSVDNWGKKGTYQEFV